MLFSAKMKMFAITFLCLFVLCTANTELDEDDRMLNVINESGDFPDPFGDDEQVDEKKFLEETGVGEMDPDLKQKFEIFAKKMINNSGDLKKAVDKAKDKGKLNFSIRKDINVAFWRELWKNWAIYKPDLKEMAKMLPSSIKDKMTKRLSKTWNSVKNFFRHPKKSITQKRETSHVIQKRMLSTGVLLAISFAAAIFIFFVIPLAFSGRR